MTAWGVPGPTEVKPYLSATQLNMLTKCAKQYEWRYIEGIRSPPGVAALIGKGTHRSIEKNLGNKLSAGVLLGEDAVAQLAVDAIRSGWAEEEPMLTDDEAALGADKVRGQAEDMGASLAQLHHRQLAPLIQPLALEEGFTLVLDGFPFDLVGYKDIVEKGRVRDTKTKGKAPAANEADLSVQMTIYSLESAARGERVELAMDFLVKTAKPKVVTLTAKRTPEDHQRLLGRVEVAARQIESGVFPPTDPTSWACSPKWCGYWDRCEFGGKQKVSMGLIDPARLTSRPKEAYRQAEEVTAD